MSLPNFIIIGAMKSGTTTLHESLEMHPQIGMSKYKEPNYFSKYYQKSKKWYSSLFSDGKINGEATPAYTWTDRYPKVPERIKATVPNAKLIYILRDPIDRIISHLHHDLYRDRFKLDKVDQKVLEDPHYITTSKYYYQLTKYLKYYRMEDILVMEMSELRDNPNNSLNEICDFIGVENFDFDEKVKVSNQSSKRYLIKHHDLIHRFFPKKATKLYHLLFYAMNMKINRPKLKEETLLKLKEELIDDVEQLRALTNKDFKNWKTYMKINSKVLEKNS